MPVAKKDGANASYTHTTVTVGATSTSVLAANANRLFLLLQNISNERISLKVGATAVADQGIILEPTSTGRIGPENMFVMSQGEGNVDCRAINAICASGSKSLLVTEG